MKSNKTYLDNAGYVFPLTISCFAFKFVELLWLVLVLIVIQEHLFFIMLASIKSNQLL